MNNLIDSEGTIPIISWANSVLCPVCNKNVNVGSLVVFYDQNCNEKLWEGCYQCIAQALANSTRHSQRLADLERKVEELTSRIRAS